MTVDPIPARAEDVIGFKITPIRLALAGTVLMVAGSCWQAARWWSDTATSSRITAEAVTSLNSKLDAVVTAQQAEALRITRLETLQDETRQRVDRLETRGVR